LKTLSTATEEVAVPQFETVVRRVVFKVKVLIVTEAKLLVVRYTPRTWYS